MLAAMLFDSPQVNGVLIAGIVAFVFCFAIGMRHWQLAKERDAERERLETEADLKDKMIDRGMSADEIARVLSARLPKE